MTAAIRNPRTGTVHADSGLARLNPGSTTPPTPIAECARQIEDAEYVTWDDTAPDDRCGHCTRRTTPPSPEQHPDLTDARTRATGDRA